MLMIRLQRIGKKNQAFFRVVLQEKSWKTQGKAKELLGFYNPHTKEKNFQDERIKFWFSRGAQALGIKKMYDGGKEGDFIGITQGAILTLGPMAFAKLATDPRGVKFLTSGFNLKPGSKAIVPNAVRMIKLLRDINKKENKAKINAERRKQFQAKSAKQKRQLTLSTGGL